MVKCASYLKKLFNWKMFHSISGVRFLKVQVKFEDPERKQNCWGPGVCKHRNKIGGKSPKNFSWRRREY
jgi:hypothetical protein